MKRATSKLRQRRRGAMAVLAAVFLVVLIAMIAFAVDIGYLAVVRTQLQAAADSAALAAAGSSNLSQSQMVSVAQQFANANQAAGRAIQLNASDVQFGTWNATSRTFTPSSAAATAVKVTVRTDSSDGGASSLFFGRIFGLSSINQRPRQWPRSIPRDIAFVIDLSGSMNDDTSPGSSTSSSSLMQTVYNEFGFGTYPGSTATLSSTTLNTTNAQTVADGHAERDSRSQHVEQQSVSYWGSYFNYAKQQLEIGVGLSILSGFHDALRSGREARRHELHSLVAEQQSLRVSAAFRDGGGNVPSSSRRTRCPLMPPAPR